MIVNVKSKEVLVQPSFNDVLYCAFHEYIQKKNINISKGFCLSFGLDETDPESLEEELYCKYEKIMVELGVMSKNDYITQFEFIVSGKSVSGFSGYDFEANLKIACYGKENRIDKSIKE